MKKRIGMILRAKFPPDHRVEKEAKSLIENGFSVFILCVKEKNQPEEEILNNIKINRIDFSAQNKILKKIYSLFFYLTFYHPFWAKNIKTFVKKNKINFLHVHDLPLVKTAYKVSKKMKIPVVADLHENYPEAVEFYTYKSRSFNRLFLKKKRWINYERKYLRKVDKIITIVEESKQRILKYGIKEDKIFVISNLEDVDFFNNIKIDNSIIEKYKDYFVVFYVGGFGPHRGIDCVIRSIKFIKEKIPNLKLVLVGGGNLYEKEMKNMVEKLKIFNFVDFEGWQPFEKIPSYIEASNVCLVPYNKNSQTNASSPNKLFEYMLKGKPIIVSDCKSLARIVNETKSGFVFSAGDAKDLAKKILHLYEEKKLQDTMGENGKRAVFLKYNWARESEKLIKIYE